MALAKYNARPHSLASMAWLAAQALACWLLGLGCLGWWPKAQMLIESLTYFNDFLSSVENLVLLFILFTFIRPTPWLAELPWIWESW